MTTTLATIAGPNGPRLLIRHDGRLHDAADGLGDGDVGDLFRRGQEAIDADPCQGERAQQHGPDPDA